jgi:hypothetical protein
MLLVFVLITTTTAKTIKNYRRGLAKDLFGLIDNLFDGELTFFHPKTEGGAQGSCGPIQNDDSQIVALVNRFINVKNVNYCYYHLVSCL